MPRFAALLLAIVATAARAKQRPIRISVARGKVAEVCMPLAEGDRLRWRFQASVALDFNLHHPVGQTLQAR